MLGAALGGIVSGAMSDRFGRRRAVNICVVLALPIGIAVAYSPNYITFIGLRFLHAIVSAIGIVCFTMVMEVSLRSRISMDRFFSSGLRLRQARRWTWEGRPPPLRDLRIDEKVKSEYG